MHTTSSMPPIPSSSSRGIAAPMPGSAADVGRRRSVLLQRLQTATTHAALLSVLAAAEAQRTELPPRPAAQQLHAGMMRDLACALASRLRDATSGLGEVTGEVYAAYAARLAEPGFAELAETLEARLLHETRACLGVGLSLLGYLSRWDAARTRLADLERVGGVPAALKDALMAQLHAAAQEALLHLETAATVESRLHALAQVAAFTGMATAPCLPAQLRLITLGQAAPRSAWELELGLQAALEALPHGVAPLPAHECPAAPQLAASLPRRLTAEEARPLVEGLRAVLDRAAELERVPAYEARALHAVVGRLGEALGLADIPLQLEPFDTSGDAALAAALDQQFANEALEQEAALARQLEEDEYEYEDEDEEETPAAERQQRLQGGAAVRLEDALAAPRASAWRDQLSRR